MSHRLLTLALLVSVPLDAHLGADALPPATFAQAKLDDDTYGKLQLLLERGAAEVQLNVTSKTGKNAEVAGMIVQHGGQIRFRMDEIDYLRVVWPFTSVSSVEALAGWAGIQAVSATYSGERPITTLTLTPNLNPQPKGEPPLPLTKPHLPLWDVDGDALRRASATFDGRGVTIAQIEESMPDLLHPHLRYALDLQGNVVPKFAQATTAGDSRDDRTGRLWVRMKESVASADGRFVWNGKTYLVPRDGRFRFGLLSRPIMSSYRLSVPIAGQDDKKSVVIPMLWDETTGEVWVDTNANGSFHDERALRSYRGPDDIGVFGVDDPETLRRETLGFTVTIDAPNHAVRVNPAWGGHATSTASAAVGEGYANGAFDALAGKARLAVYAPSPVWDSYAVIEAAAAALADPQVDVAFYEQNSYQHGAYSGRAGTSALTVALDRLVRRSKKLVFFPAGNGYGTNFVDEISLGDNLISIQAYNSRDSLRLISQIETLALDNLHTAGAFGPADDGALKPDLMAPSGNLTVEPQFFDDSGPKRFPGVWELPYGISTGGGTSCAAPTAAAAAALVISAAKQTGINYEGSRLRTALFSTARFCDGLQAHQQGRGLIQVGKSWELLQYLNRQPNWEAPQIEASASVRTKDSGRLPTPHRGRGLFEREGWKAGDAAVRAITLTRRNGPKEPLTYDLEWLGDVAQFTAESRTITLPLDIPVELPVHIDTPEARVYSAILRLKPVNEPYEAKAVLLTVIAAEQPALAEAKTVTRQWDIPRPGVRSMFVHVPAGTERMIVQAAKGSEELLRCFVHPPKIAQNGQGSENFWLREGEKEVVINRPETGVWEIYMNNRAMLNDNTSAAAMANDPAMRERLAKTGARQEPEPRPVPLTPTAVKFTVRFE